MRRFWVVLLAAAMVAGFALSASAADVKFSGSYYALGTSANNWGLGDKDDATTASLYAQRLRMGMELKIAEGLTLNTRFDALEGRWGQFGAYGGEYTHNTDTYDEQNISFDRAWVDFAVPFGKFRVGRANSAAWGTIFANNDVESDQIWYSKDFGSFDAGVIYEKFAEYWDPSKGQVVQADADNDRIHVYGRYKWKSGIAGLKIAYQNDSSRSGTAPAATNPLGGYYKSNVWAFAPYFQATFGPVFVEGEINYVIGKAANYEGEANRDDVDVEGWDAYLHAKADIGPAYVGGMYAWVDGQDADDGDVTKGTAGGRSFNPCLILWNEYTNKWIGPLGYGNNTYDRSGDAMGGESMTNAHLFQVYGGYKPLPKLDIRAAVSYALADEKSNNQFGANAVDYKDRDLGWEVDLTAAYKIYDNLTYTVGVGYLWAGDYWKGADEDNNVDDTYLLLHRLDLTF